MNNEGAISDSSAAAARGLLVGQLVVCPLFFTTLTQEAFEYGKAVCLVLTAMALVALGLCALLQSWARGVSIRSWLGDSLRTPLAWGVVLFLISATVSTVWSISPRVSWHGEHNSQGGLLTIAGYAVLYFATRSLVRGAAEARLLLGAALIGSTGALLYAVAQLCGADLFSWNKNALLDGFSRPFGSLGHPNFLAGYLVMTLPLTGYFLARALRRRQRGLALLCAALVPAALLVIVLTLTRGAWIALGAVLLCCLLGLLGRGRLVLWKRAARVCVLSGLVAGLCLLIVPGLHERCLWVGERALRSSTVDTRLLCWQGSLALFAEQPLVGTGLDTFRLVFGSVRVPAYNTLEWNTTPLRPHNLVLEVLAGQGLLGGLAMLVMLVGCCQAARRAWADGRNDRNLVLALIALSVGFVVQGLFSLTQAATGALFITALGLLSRLGEGTFAVVDDRPRPGFRAGLMLAVVLLTGLYLFNLHDVDEPLRAAAICGQVAVILGIVGSTLLLLGSEENSAEPLDGAAPPQPARWPVLAGQVGIGCLLAGLAWIWVLQPARAELAMRRGDRLVDPWEALRAYDSATRLDPGHELHWFGLARHLQKLAAHAQSPDERVELLEQARAACERAIALVPGYGAFHGCRARLLADLARLKRDEPGVALAEFDRALDLDPCHAYLLADAANAALTLSQLDKARDYTERGLACYPQFAVLRAHRGYLAMVAKDYDKACAELYAAVEFGNWYGDSAGQEFARRMLEQAARLRDRVAVEKTR